MITLISPSQAAIDPGLRTISSYLKNNGHEVNLLFLKRRFEKEIDQDVVERIAQISKDSLLVGVSLMTHEFLLCADLTRKLKKMVDIPVVWGGPHPMVMPEECLRYCDYVCTGEGERVTLELANHIQASESPSDVVGMWYRTKGGIKRNPLVPPIEDLDDLPFPDYSFQNHYLLRGNELQLVTGEEGKKEIMGSTYYLYSQRGCPFVCSYCINHFFLKQHRGKFHRSRSVSNIMEELKEVKRNFPFINSICFDSDDFLSMSEEELESLAPSYKKEIDLPFHVNATPRNLTERKIKILLEAGLNDVSMGIQSGSNRTLKLYRRASSKEDVLRATHILNKFHPQVRANYDFILDNPWESGDDLVESLRLLNEIPRPYRILLYSLTLYPGTELYRRAKEENLIRDEMEEIYTKSYHTDISNTYFNSLFYLYATLPFFPKTLGRVLTDRGVVYSPLFAGLRFCVTCGTPVLKGLHFMKFIASAAISGNTGLLRNYFKVAIREIRKIFGSRQETVPQPTKENYFEEPGSGDYENSTILDLSTKRRVEDARHWAKEISQLYHPTGAFGQDGESLVYSGDNLNTTKFAPILLKEWFYLVKEGGYLIIDYKPNKICDWKKLEESMWWLWKMKYEVIFHGAIGSDEVNDLSEKKLRTFIENCEKYYQTNLDKESLLPEPLPTQTEPKVEGGYLRFICKKIASTKIEEDDINKWTFGIITNGRKMDWVEKIIESIRRQKIPHYEIIVCGKYYDRKEPDFEYIPFDQRDDLGWISKKKNLIVRSAKYENLCIVHDRVFFDDDWFEGMKRWGNCFDHLACVQLHDGRQVNDWMLCEKLERSDFGFASLLDHRDWDFNVYQGGQLHITKRSSVEKFPWKEPYVWGNPEDVEISNNLRDGGHILRFNPHAKCHVLHHRLGKLPKIPFDKLKLSKKRTGNTLRIFGRVVYKYTYRIELLHKLFFRLLEFLKYK